MKSRCSKRVEYFTMPEGMQPNPETDQQHIRRHMLQCTETAKHTTQHVVVHPITGKQLLVASTAR